jgi:hypothetical protein
MLPEGVNLMEVVVDIVSKSSGSRLVVSTFSGQTPGFGVSSVWVDTEEDGEDGEEIEE